MNEVICGIYKITNPEGKVYIGQSTNINLRFRVYKRIACKSQFRIFNSLKKYGVESHLFEIIKECDHLDLNDMEIKFIKEYDSVANGLNCLVGGAISNITKLRYNKEDNTIVIKTTYALKWQLRNATHYKVSPDGKMFNCRTNKQIKKTMVGRSIGFCIEGKFRSLNSLRTELELIPKKELLPF